MTRAELSSALLAAVEAAVADGELAVRVPAQAPLTWEGHSPLALRLAAEAGLPAAAVASVLARRVGRGVRVTGPGFLSFPPPGPHEVITEILAAAQPSDTGAEGAGDAGDAGPAHEGARDDEAAVEAGAAHEGAGPAHGVWPEWPRTFENPGFRVRFAYVRAKAVQRWAGEYGIAAEPAEWPAAGEEKALVGALTQYPARLAAAGRKQSSDPLRRHLERIAAAYHDVYERCPALPKGDMEPDRTHAARVALAAATGTVLRDGLTRLGEHPRERL